MDKNRKRSIQAIESEWQPAVLMSVDHMCSYHRVIWEKEAGWLIKEKRTSYEGKKVFVRKVNDEVTLSGFGTVPNNDCLPLDIKLDKYNRGRCFTCEVSTD